MMAILFILILFCTLSLSSMEKPTPSIENPKTDPTITIKTSDNFIFHMPKELANRSFMPIRMQLEVNPSQDTFEFRSIDSTQFMYCYLYIMNNGNDRRDIEQMFEELDDTTRKELIDAYKFLEYWPLLCKFPECWPFLIEINLSIIQEELKKKQAKYIIISSDHSSKIYIKQYDELTLLSLDPDYLYQIEMRLRKILNPKYPWKSTGVSHHNNIEKAFNKKEAAANPHAQFRYVDEESTDDMKNTIRILHVEESISSEFLLSFPNLKDLNIGFEFTALEALDHLSGLKRLRWSPGYPHNLKTLSSKIGLLTNLIELDLSYNHLTTLPPEIGQLTSLERLNLSFENSIGVLPPEFGNLTNLKELEAYNNRHPDGLSSIPNLRGLTKLAKLGLRCNRFSPLTPDIGRLVNLQDLDLSANELKELPPEIGLLSNLQQLNLQQNELECLPEEFGNLAQLERLDICSNKLGNLPETFSRLTNLEHLDATSNNFTAIPAQLSCLMKLKELYLHHTSIEATPTKIHPLTALTNLERLWIWNKNRRRISLTPREKEEIENMFEDVSEVRVC